MKKQMQEYIEIIKSEEYMQELQNIAERLKVEALKASNEATIESRFDCELFAFFRKHFEKYGFEYNPKKEYPVKTTRHIAKGHADTAISTLVVEFKQLSTLSNDTMKKKAVSQISEYLKGIKQENDDTMIEGYVTDGTQGCFITYSKKGLSVEEFLPISKISLDRIIQNILSLKLRAFNANNLVESFCNPPINDGIAFDLVKILYSMLKENMQQKSKMLFIEWKELFNLAHDDISKQQAIIDRRRSLQNLLKTQFDDTDDEYLALFSLQTAYAIIIKVIAFKILSQIRFNTSLISFSETMGLDSDSLRYRFENLENGDIFRDYGMTNLLEGDFFSWYCSKKQWTNELSTVLKGIFEILSGYSEKAVLNNTKRSQDFFKKLYEAMVPAAVRHSLGEYYTKKWLAQNVVEEAIKLSKVDNWKGLDPCCGSGTFLNVMIDKILYDEKSKSNDEKLEDILHRVKGIDLNPIAVLTARVNYFINISHLFDNNRPIDIPVYLGDASYVPREIEYDSVNCYDYVINTTMDPINITIPASMVSDPSKFAQQMINVEIQVKNQNENRGFWHDCGSHTSPIMYFYY